MGTLPRFTTLIDDHLIYHLVLPYSNWETGTICFSESFESLSEGLQNALWELGGVPERHQTDRLTSAVHKMKLNAMMLTVLHLTIVFPFVYYL
jgi:hypothetical protein